MIVDQLSHAALYERMTKHYAPRLRSCAHGSEHLLKGRYEIAGDDAYAVVHEYDTKLADQATWEGHRKHIDAVHPQRRGKASSTTSPK